MSDGIGKGRTREDHEDVARQLYAACARVARARSLEAIIGREELSEQERRYLRFGEVFEQRFLAQGRDEMRPIPLTLQRAWEALRELPAAELTRVSGEFIERYGDRASGVAT